MISKYHEAFLCVENVEESKEKVECDVKKGLKSDRPDLHEPGAVVLVLLHLKDYLEEEEDKEGAKDDGDGDGRGEGEAKKPLKEKLLKNLIFSNGSSSSTEKPVMSQSFGLAASRLVSLFQFSVVFTL